ncbi:rho GTPase-activating protein 11A-like [Gastrophryne carolinensis]
MRATGPSVVIIQHLKSMGIKLRLPKKTVSPDAQRKTSSGGLFGVPLQSLPPNTEREVPQLVVEICQFLGCHLSTEGLFRKSGSVNRIKTLKAQLESGDSCLSSAHPSDVAALLKQFFRELPQPLLTPELQDPLCQIQQSLCEEERSCATTLVTCLLPTIHRETLKFLCTFLQNVASRSDENRMDSGNLAVVLAPSLFSSSNLGEKLTLATEKQLQLQASAIQSLIEQAQDIGQLPLFILEKISLPCDAGEEDSVGQNLEGLRRKRRRSMSGIVNEALSKLKSGRGPSNLVTDRATDEVELPLRSKAKRKASEDSGCGELCTPKKRKSIQGTIDGPTYKDELLEPNGSHSLLLDDAGGGDVFSDASPGNFLDFHSESPAILPTPETSFHGTKGRAKRRNSKRAKRMQSGQIAISPAQLDRKEKVRNSLRLFHRARAPKQPTPEGKNLEQSGWNMMKKMVADALDVPIFNGRDSRGAPSSLKSLNSVNTPDGKDCLQLPPTPCSLRSSPWKPLPLDTIDVEVPYSGRRSRTLRRSLSMPEIVGECVQTKEDQAEPSLSMNKEGESRDDALIYSLENTYVQVQDGYRPSLKHCWNTTKSHSLDSQDSVPVPTLRMPLGHTAQYRSVRKLVLSFPWMPSVSSIDAQQKDLEMLATHTIKRKGARRFGRSISQECGLGTNEGLCNNKRPEDTIENTSSRPLGGRNRQVFVSRKTITLSQYGEQGHELQRQEAIDDDSTDTELPLSDALLSLNEALNIQEIEGKRQRYRASPKCPHPGSRLEPIRDTVAL